MPMYLCVRRHLLCSPRNGVQAWRICYPKAQRTTWFRGRVVLDDTLGRANRTQSTACYRREAQQGSKQRKWSDTRCLCKGVLGKTEILLFWCKGMSPKRGLIQRDESTANLQATRNRKEEAIFVAGNWDRAWDIYVSCIYWNRRNGWQMSQVSLPIGGAYIDEERRALGGNTIVDTM